MDDRAAAVAEPLRDGADPGAGPAQGLEVHGTAVALGGAGVLILGPSGAGKSDLALRLIDGGARLVADDRCTLARARASILLGVPAALAGLLEVRGLGVVPLTPVGPVSLALVVELAAPATIERLPPPSHCNYLDVKVPRIMLAPFETSAVAKLRVALEWALTGRSIAP